MFMQVISGQVSDRRAVHSALDRWSEELAPGAPGWLGSTAGVTADGRFIAVARFESAAQAKRNSDRPEQDQWWTEMSKLFDGEVTFEDTDDAIVDLVGDPDKAGFVQLMRGKGTDPKRARELMGAHSKEWREFRPEMLGSIGGQYEGGRYAMAMYFTSEAAAREGERKEPPAALKADIDELNALGAGAPEFYDLTEPWLYGPR